MDKNVFKGFNKIVKAEKGKRGKKVIQPSPERVEKKLDMLRSGKQITSEEKGTYKMLFNAPDKLVQEIIQTLRFGATKEEIIEACQEHDLLKAADWSLGRSTIMAFAKERGVNLTTVAHIFGLESEDTTVVDSSEDVAAE